MKAPKQEVKRSEVLPEGVYAGRLYQMINVGHIKGFEDKMQAKIRLSFELSDELREFKKGEPKKPLSISKKYTFSMFERAPFRKTIEALIGTSLTDTEADAFNVEEAMGKGVLITIKNKEGKNGKYHYVDSISPLMKGQTIPPLFNKPIVFDFENFDSVYFESMPDFIKEEIKTSVEYQKMHGITDTTDPNEIPF